MPSFVELQNLLGELALRDETGLTRLFELRPDLAHPPPADTTTLGLRASSEMSLRLFVQGLDAPGLDALGLACAASDRGITVAALLEDAADPDSAPDSAPEHRDPGAVRSGLRRLRTACLILPADGDATAPDAALPAADLPTDAGLPDDADPSAATDPLRWHWSVQSRLPHILTAFQAGLGSPAARHPAPRTGSSAPSQQVPAALVGNGSLAAITELLDDVNDLLAALTHAPLQRLRSGGVGMRELRRLTGLRRPGAGTADADIGETGWLLELTAAAGLIELDVDSGCWLPTALATAWRGAARHHRHQLLVSGWMLVPRSPLLLRGPHRSARIAPALGSERQRGDAPELRRLMLRTAVELERSAGAGPRSRVRAYRLELPDDDVPGDDALSGALDQALLHRHPVYTARIRGALPWMLREAERLGLFAAGALSEAGAALQESAHAMGDAVAAALPAQVESIVVQSDLTAVATGALSAPTARALEDLGRKEGRGAVPTYRFTTDSLHRAMERGWTQHGIREWLAERSLTSLPSALTTLVEDAARSFSAVRLGTAGCWITVPDAETRDRLLADPVMQGLGALALTDDVVVMRASARDAAPELRRLGIPVVAADGAADHDAGTPTRRGPRSEDGPAEDSGAWVLTSSPWQGSPVRARAGIAEEADPDEVTEAVRAVRSADVAPQTRAGAAPDLVGTLRAAVAARRRVRITVVTGQGRAASVIGVPTAVNAGRVRVRRSEKEEDAIMLLHRIGTVEDAATAHDDRPTGPKGASR